MGEVVQKQAIEDIVEAFIRERFRVSAEDSYFSKNVNLWEEGYVDSAGVIEMIAFLEKRFELTLPEEVLWDPDFTHVQGIAGLVAQTLATKSTVAHA